MSYITVASGGAAELGTVLIVLNLIALAVFFFTIYIDAITRSVERMRAVLHKVHWPLRSPR